MKQRFFYTDGEGKRKSFSFRIAKRLTPKGTEIVQSMAVIALEDAGIRKDQRYIVDVLRNGKAKVYGRAMVTELVGSL